MEARLSLLLLLLTVSAQVTEGEDEKKEKDCGTLTEKEAMEDLKSAIARIRDDCGEVCQVQKEKERIGGEGKYYKIVRKKIECR